MNEKIRDIALQLYNDKESNWRTNIADQKPQYPIPIDSAGIQNCTIQFPLLNAITGETLFTPISCQIRAPVSPQKRGLHISRIYEAIIAIQGMDNAQTLPILAAKILEEAMDRLQVESGAIEMHVILGLMGTSPTTNKAMQHIVEWKAGAKADCMKWNYNEGITATIISACPCTLAFSEEILQKKSKSYQQLKTDLDGLLRFGATHIQRGKLCITRNGTIVDSKFSGLWNIVTDSCLLAHDLLKRPDEITVVAEAQNNPQFSEDIVRNIANKVLGIDEFDGDTIEISVQVQDSIHDYDIIATILIRENEYESDNKSHT